MSTKYWRWSIVCVAMARLVLNQAGAAPVTIGIPLPHGQVQGEEMTESMRQSLISQLKAQSIDAVPLSASTGGLEAEVQAKHCTYVLYTRVQNKHSTGSGVFGKLSLLTHGISPDAMGGGVGSVKRGDTVVLDYRLMAMGSSDPVKADSLSAKAAADGEDVVSPLMAQLTSAVAAAAQGKQQGTGAGAGTDGAGIDGSGIDSNRVAGRVRRIERRPVLEQWFEIWRIFRAQKHFECENDGRKHGRRHGLREARQHAERTHVA